FREKKDKTKTRGKYYSHETKPRRARQEFWEEWYESHTYSPTDRRPGKGGHPQRDAPHAENPRGHAHGDFHRCVRRGDFEKVSPGGRDVHFGPVVRSGARDAHRPGGPGVRR